MTTSDKTSSPSGTVQATARDAPEDASRTSAPNSLSYTDLRTRHPVPPRTYLYKLTSDRGGAPCAPPPSAGQPHLLTLSICKPAIRRTAQPGDRLLGLSSHALAHSDGYPLAAVIYAAIVDETHDARAYFAERSPFRSRPDCIYQFHRDLGTIDHRGNTPLHADPAYRDRDLGSYPFYRNGRTLLSRDFRYFGPAAPVLPARLTLLHHIVDTLGQGHRVFTPADPAHAELDTLFRHLWRSPTRHSPASVTTETRGHTPRPRSGTC